MNKRGGGIPMAERVRMGRPPGAAPEVPGPGLPGVPVGPHDRSGPGARVPACPARHCWVLDAADLSGEKRAGLLVEWRRGTDGWEGQVAYLVRREGRGWLLTLEWFPERSLEVAVMGGG